MKLSVIIPCLNAAGTVATQFEALASQNYSEPWEVIVSDNGSTDDLVNVVKRYMSRLPDLRIVDASDKRGQAHARNIGAKCALGKRLFFCDADDEVAPGWLSAMGEALSKYDFVACRIDANKLSPSWVTKQVRHSQASGLQPKGELSDLPHAGGGTLGVKRWIHETIGGFDESLALCEDTDYCWNIQLKGVTLHFVPEAVMHVRLRDTIIGNYRQAVGWANIVFSCIRNIFLSGCQNGLGTKLASWKNFIIWFVKSIPHIRDKSDRAVWARRCGAKIGRLKGSIKYRILAI